MSSPSISPSTNEAATPPARKRNPVVAFLLSVIAPGLGQIYARQPLRGLWMAASIAGLLIAAQLLGLLLHFRTAAPIILSVIILRLIVSVDAAQKTRRPITEIYRFNPIAVGAAILLLAIAPAFAGMPHGFRMNADSMCPTLCIGERFAGDMSAFRKSTPNRGDLIIYTGPAGQMLIKRVVGIEGDQVESGTNGAVLVNGTPMFPGSACGNPIRQGGEDTTSPAFAATAVPANSLFVIGDNLPNSFDSRIPGFGFVSVSRVLGKPIFIYWSAGKDRVGCQLE